MAGPATITVTVSTPAMMVRQFHEACDLPVRTTPALPHPSEEGLRWRLLAEEWKEYQEAVTAADLVEIADALADMVYVIYGTALSYGIDLDAVLAEVHRSNMAKAVDGKVVRREDGKILKPEGWEPPRIAQVLADHSWHVKVGDAPTARRPAGTDSCHAIDDGFMCTREVDHPGRHIANGTTQVWAVWS